MFRSLFLLFLLIPLIEIYFLIEVGEVIGAGWTVFLVIATAVIGAALIRVQGLTTLQRAQLSLAQGQLPAMAMLEGVALFVSGGMLLTPGFFTDTLGFLLLIPPLRQALIRKMMQRGTFVSGARGYQQTHHKETHIIEGEIVDDEDDKKIR